MPSGNLVVHVGGTVKSGEWRSFYLSDELIARLEALAQSRQVAESTIVREGLETVLGKNAAAPADFDELYFQHAEAHPS